MSLLQKNTRKQGDVGLGLAIAYFTRQGYSVSVPLTESQRYDIIVDDGENLYRVEVKTTRYRKEGQSFAVMLSTQGGNQSWNGEKRKFSARDADYLFVTTSEGSNYLIPADVADGKASLVLSYKMQQYLV